jgi:hypothetical protein
LYWGEFLFIFFFLLGYNETTDFIATFIMPTWSNMGQLVGGFGLVNGVADK